MKYLLETQQRLLALYGQEIYTDYLPVGALLRRANLVREEANELIYALHNFNTKETTPEQRAHFLKEFADTLVVLFGTAAQLGFTDEELEEAYDIVHIDNMGKAYMHKEDAQMAKDYYYKSYPGDFHVKEITMPPVSATITIKGDGELAVEPIPLTYYVVANEEGKIMKRYPAPATTAEERIYQYITKGSSGK